MSGPARSLIANRGYDANLVRRLVRSVGDSAHLVQDDAHANAEFDKWTTLVLPCAAGQPTWHADDANALVNILPLAERNTPT